MMQEVLDLIRWHQEWERAHQLKGPFLKFPYIAKR
jgi:hypothetical protein